MSRVSREGEQRFSSVVRCYTCRRPSWTEREHIGHRCNPLRAWLVLQWRRFFEAPRPVELGPAGRLAMSRDEGKGLYRKYSVRRLNDDKGKHDGCEFFVLDWMHDKFAIYAGIAYANACRTTHPKLSEELAKLLKYYAGFHGFPVGEVDRLLAAVPA